MLIIVAGPLGSGKTTISKAVANRINGEYISVDKILSDNGLDQISEGSFCIPLANFLKANQLMLPVIAIAQAAKQPIVVDGCFYHREAFEDLLRLTVAPHFVYTLQLPLLACIERDRKRDQPLGEEAARGVYALTSKLVLGSVIDAAKPVSKNVDRIVKDTSL